MRITITRREALGAAALGGARIFAAGGYKPAMAAGVYVWTQQFQRERKTVFEGVDEALAATRRAGYRRVELMSVFLRPEVRDKTLKALREHRLALASVYNGGPMHSAAEAEKSIADTLEIAAVAGKAGAQWINFNPSPKPKREPKTDAELEAQARYVNQLAGALKAQGLRLKLHHHEPEMRDNAREWRHLKDHTEPSAVFFCLDLDWVRRGGQDPLALLRAAGPRLASLHLRNSRNDVWTESFGEGDIDYQPVAAYLKQAGFQGLLIIELAHQKETQITRSLEENLRQSRVFAERLFGRA